MNPFQITPELVTPIGIAIAAKKAPIHYMILTVNEQVVRLFELKEMTVADAFLAANIRAKQLYGKPGHGLSLTVNGQDIFIPGEHGQPARILVNGEEASTKTLIKSGDRVDLIEGKDGQDSNSNCTRYCRWCIDAICNNSRYDHMRLNQKYSLMVN